MVMSGEVEAVDFWAFRGLDMAVGVMFMVELRTGEREAQVAQRQTTGGLARPGTTCEFFTRVRVYR